MTHDDESGQPPPPRSLGELRDWLVNMILDGWEPKVFGTGKHLSLERDEVRYQDRVGFLNEAAVGEIGTTSFWCEVKHRREWNEFLRRERGEDA